jgi:hypothetical protein
VIIDPKLSVDRTAAIPAGRFDAISKLWDPGVTRASWRFAVEDRYRMS